MIWKNTPARYGAISKSFHWLLALGVVGMLMLGFYMTGLQLSPALFTLYFWHKSIGIIILTLVVLRLIWRLMQKLPDPLPGHRIWERRAAKLTHAFLYIALFGMPLSGWLMSSAKGFPVSVFGWFTLPDLVAADENLAAQMVRVHSVLAWMLLGAVALHSAGALKHHLIDRDATLRRMLPFGKL